MPPHDRATPRPRGAGPRPRLRTYVLLAIGADAGPVDYARPLGTLVAATRAMARAAACAIHADVAPCNLRAVAAGSAPAGFLARALALDGERMLLGGGHASGAPR